MTLTLPNTDNKYVRLMPEMTPEEYKELKEDIRHKAVGQALLVDEDNNLIDGRHRWKAWSELIEEGCDLPIPDIIRRRFESEEAKIDYVISMNVKRRHLTYEQRQELIVKLRKEYGYAMQRIADMLSINVATVSRDLAALPEADRAELMKVEVLSKNNKVFSGEYAPRMLFVTGESTIAKAQSIARGEESVETRTDALEAAMDRFKVEVGQLWFIPSKNQQGRSHRLLVGSCLKMRDVASLFDNGTGFEPGRTRLVVTSPPYNQDLSTFRPTGMQMENNSFVERMRGSYQDSKPEPEYRVEQVTMMLNLNHVTTSDASFFYNHKNRIRDSEVLSPLQWIWTQTLWKLRLEIVWDRSSSITLNARMFVPCDERIYWLVKDPSNFYFADTTEIKAYTTVWRFAARNEQDFSAPFPNELPHRCIVACSEMGDIVLDPYSGTGTTIAECERLSRIGYGIEIDPRYVAGSLQRFESMGLEPTLAPF